MSDRKKRLTNEGVRMFWEAPTSSDLHALKRDHLQAREDVERLADLARRVLEEPHDAPESPHCQKCLAENALEKLVREVSP